MKKKKARKEKKKEKHHDAIASSPDLLRWARASWRSSSEVQSRLETKWWKNDIKSTVELSYYRPLLTAVLGAPLRWFHPDDIWGPAAPPSTIPHSWWMRLLAGRWQGGRLCCYRTAPRSTGLLKAKSPGRVLNVRPFINHSPAGCFWGPDRPHTALRRKWKKKKLSQRGSSCAEQKVNHLQADAPAAIIVRRFFFSEMGTLTLLCTMRFSPPSAK